MVKKKKTKNGLELEEKLLVGIVATSAVMVAMAFVVDMIPTPSERAEVDLAEMADGYYLTYLYPRILGTNKDLKQAFQRYDTVGIPTVLLRQLLHYSEENEARGEDFAAVECNTNTTGIRYFPKAPYGPHDYEVMYYWDCGEKEE